MPNSKQKTDNQTTKRDNDDKQGQSADTKTGSGSKSGSSDGNAGSGSSSGSKSGGKSGAKR